MRTAQPRSLILDVYGAFARPLGGWLAVSHLIALMEELGVEEQAVRSAISRMKRRGLLTPSRRLGAMGYALTGAAMEVLADGDARIFRAREPARPGDPWLMVVYSVPETQRDRRHVLRSRLAWLGFGNLAAGVWAAPMRVRAEAEAMVRRLGLESRVDLYEGHYLGFADLAALVERCWDLEALRALYQRFLADQEPVLRRWEQVRRPAPPGLGREAFVDYVLALQQWRELPYLDPGLPAELLPEGWEGERARRLFQALAERVEPLARGHVEAGVRGGRGRAGGEPSRGEGALASGWVPSEETAP